MTAPLHAGDSHGTTARLARGIGICRRVRTAVWEHCASAWERIAVHCEWARGAGPIGWASSGLVWSAPSAACFARMDGARYALALAAVLSVWAWNVTAWNALTDDSRRVVVPCARTTSAASTEHSAVSVANAVGSVAASPWVANEAAVAVPSPWGAEWNFAATSDGYSKVTRDASSSATVTDLFARDSYVKG